MYSMYNEIVIVPPPIQFSDLLMNKRNLFIYSKHTLLHLFNQEFFNILVKNNEIELESGIESDSNSDQHNIERRSTTKF